MTSDQQLKICKLSCSVLKLSLIWPPQNQEFNPSRWFYIRQILFLLFAVLPLVVLLFLHLIKSLEEGHIDVSEDIALIASIFGLTTMMALFVYKQKELATLLLDLSNFDTFGKPPNFDAVNQKLQLAVKFASLYAVVSTVIYNLTKIVDIENCRRARKIREACGPLIPIWTPFDADSWPVLSVLTIYVLLFAIVLDRATPVVSAQILEIVYNIDIRVKQLNSMIKECFEVGQKDRRKKFNECIYYHISLIDERFNDCYTYQMFVYLSTAGIICGCLENQIVKLHDVGAILHFLGWMGALFACSYSGQTLIDTTTSVAQAAYESDWYNADVELQKDLMLVIMRSQKPMFLSTGAFNILSFALFASIMKMSFSILTLLS